MAKISIKITDEQIEAKKEAFLSDIAKKSELAKSGITSPTKIFLEKIKDVIKVAIDSGLGYKEISRSIYGQWNVRISEQTLRAFARNTLGVETKQRQKIESKPIIEKQSIAAPIKETPATTFKHNPDSTKNVDDLV